MIPFVRVTVAGAALILLLGHAAGEPPGPGAGEIERLIKRLGSDSFEEREEAGKRLIEVGVEALPALRKASRSDDLEVRRRASELLGAVQSGRGGHFDPALRVMLREPAKGDPEHKTPFFVALSSLARKHRAKTEGQLPAPVDGGFAVVSGTGHVVAVLMADPRFAHRNNTQHLLLLGPDGRILDQLSCKISGHLVDPEDYRTDVPEEPEPDGARLVIRYAPKRAGGIAGEGAHLISHRGKKESFGWAQDEPENYRPVEWEKRGLCRVGIQGDRFSVLFPDGAEVERRLAAVLGRELTFWKKEGPNLLPGWKNGVGMTWDEVTSFRDHYRVTLGAVRRVRSDECRKAVEELRDLWRSLPSLKDIKQMGEECDRVLAGLKK
jgi:hypothetical protein